MGDNKKRHKRYPLPPGCSIKSFVMRELDGQDDLEIAIWVDRKTSSIVRDNAGALLELKVHEAVRRSLVEVDDEPVNVAGVPYADFDTWKHRTMRIVLAAFQELNGVESDELKKVMAAAEDVEPPTSSSRVSLVSSTDAKSAG